MSERKFEIRYSPKFTHEILGNGGIKSVVKRWKAVVGNPVKAELKPDGSLRIYEVEKI